MKKQLRRQVPPKKIVNSSEMRYSGAGTQYDYGTLNTPVSSMMCNPLQQDQLAMQLYHSDWAAQKIINIPVDDQLRDGWEVVGLDEAQEKQVERAQDLLGALESFKQAMRLERLIGGAAIFLGVSDGNDDASMPLDYDQLRPGCLKFLNVIPRNRVQRVTYNNDPLTAGYGRPEMYHVGGQQIHRSRLIIFTGSPLMSVPNSVIANTWLSRNDGFGFSKLMPLYDDIIRATGSRQAAYQLVQRSGVFFAQMDLTDLSGSVEGSSRINAVRDVVNQINAFRGAVFDTIPGSTNPPISTISPNFGSVPELMMSFLQVLSAGGDVPASRFLGQAPGGLNATGDGDLEAYYGRLESEQHQTLRPQLLQLMRVLIPSVIGGGTMNMDELDIEFTPLWSLSDLEEAQVRTADTANVVSLVTAGMITEDEGNAELKARNALMIDPGPAPGIPDPAEQTSQPFADSIKQLMNPDADPTAKDSAE